MITGIFNILMHNHDNHEKVFEILVTKMCLFFIFLDKRFR